MIWVDLSCLLVLSTIEILVDSILAALYRQGLIRRYNIKYRLHRHILDYLLYVLVDLKLIVDYLNGPNLCYGRSKSCIGCRVIEAAEVALEGADVEVADAYIDNSIHIIKSQRHHKLGLIAVFLNIVERSLGENVVDYAVCHQGLLLVELFLKGHVLYLLGSKVLFLLDVPSESFT